jgi:LPS-assembly lipoprotein
LSSRRALLLGGAALLGGCGFRPLYAPDGTRNPGAAESPALLDELAAVRVAPIGERTGQVLRRTLQRRLEGPRSGVGSRYELQASIAYNVEVLGYRQDGTITRVRYLATAPWVLTTDAVAPVEVGRGTVRTLDAYNIPDLQFFAADASREAMERRIVEEVTDRIVLGVAAALRRRLAAPPAA